MLRNLGKQKVWGGFLWGVLSDNKVICNVFQLAKNSGIGLFAPKFISESEETNDYLNYTRAVTISSEEIIRFDENGSIPLYALTLEYLASIKKKT